MWIVLGYPQQDPIFKKKVNDLYENITDVSHDEFLESDFFEQFNNAVIDYKLYLEDSSDLAKFRLIYLTMIDLLLSTVYATLTGDKEMLLEYVRDTIRYNFAYDNYNYARYLTPWLVKCSTYKCVIQSFVKNSKKGIFRSNYQILIHLVDANQIK